jgi:hypothetical protein
MPSIILVPEPGARPCRGRTASRSGSVRQPWRWLLCGLTLLCAGPVAQGSQFEPSRAAAESQVGARWRVDTAQSLVQVRVYREGLLARLGHNHLIAVRSLEGSAWRAEDGSVRAELGVAAAELTVDEPDLRRAAGAPFARQPSDEAIAATRHNLLGPRVLAAADHPRIRVLARLPVGAQAATLRIQLRGVWREYRVPLERERRDAAEQLQGRFRLRLSDFGLEPFSTLGGALRVADELGIDFSVQFVAGNP